MGGGTGGGSVGGTGGNIGGDIGQPGDPAVTGMGAHPGSGSGGLGVAAGDSGGKGDLGGNGATGNAPGTGSSSANGGGAGPVGGEGFSGGGDGAGGRAGASGGASVGPGGNGAGGGNGGATGADVLDTDPDLVVWYTFDESAGLVAADTSGASGGPRNGMLHTQGAGGAVEFSAAHRVGTHALSLTANGTASGGYANIPMLGQLAPQAMTVSAWVNISSHTAGQRVFESAASTDTIMALTTTDNNALPRFAIATRGTANDQIIIGATKLSTGEWHHLVVVLRGGAQYTGQLYIDGALAGRNAAMSMHPGDLGATHANYLGRSVFASAPFLPGLIDDFRVYRRALTAAEITRLFGLR